MIENEPTSTLTLEEFLALPHLKIFAQGVIMDGTPAFNITGKQQALRWVATKGGINDWAVYVGYEYWDAAQVAREGDKVVTQDYIRHVVPCVDEVFNLYRY